MKKTIAVLLILLTVLYACNRSGQSSLLFKPGTVPAEEYTINTDRDTILVTKNGALLNIPQGALDAGNRKQVTLEIKEAYTLEQMIRSGLTTRSGEEPMSSGGMIYLNPKKGQDVTIKKAIHLALPSRYIDPGMKLFKGETTKDGSIDWVRPDTLPVSAQSISFQNGRAIYQAKCAPCHAIGKDLTGPDLAHFMNRFTGDTLLVRGYSLHIPRHYFYKADSSNANPLYERLRHINSDLWYNQELYFCNQKSMFGSLGTFFPELTEMDLTDIYKYIQNESGARNLPMPSQHYLGDCIDSCMRYKKLVNGLYERKEELTRKKEAQITQNGRQTVEERSPAPPSKNTDPFVIPPPFFTGKEIVNPANPQALYYQFSIQSFGWYNIDVLLKELPGNQKCELAVRITGAYQEKSDVFLIIPDKKIYTKGGLKKDGSGKYVFAYADGTIYLPIGSKACILGLTENADGLAFVLHTFIIGPGQEISLELKPSSPEAFNTAISSLEMKDITIKAGKTKNSDSIRKADTILKDIENQLKEAGSIRPKNCNCSCGDEGERSVEIAPDERNQFPK